jgi:hypothetical protein
VSGFGAVLVLFLRVDVVVLIRSLSRLADEEARGSGPSFVVGVLSIAK